MKKYYSGFICFVLTTFIFGCSPPPGASPELKAAWQKHQNAYALSEAKGTPLKPYLTCEFGDGLEIVQIDHRPKDAEKNRTVETNNGYKTVSVMDGYRVIFAYPEIKFFANVKAELSDPQSYAKDKKNIIDELSHLVKISKEIDGNEVKKVINNGYTIYGFDRKTLEIGNTIGIYVFFSDLNHTITSIYFLNSEPKGRKFQTINEWRILRDRFLDKYTNCINMNLRTFIRE